ncbi:hypothetical protein [Xanthomonas bundabergensis]|uniref:hypothetical protein n=1 Tax=Xanthomonas bundabergensis TaxID=3160842 RepID=UPI0035199850
MRHSSEHGDGPYRCLFTPWRTLQRQGGRVRVGRGSVPIRAWLDGKPVGAAEAGQALTLPLPSGAGERGLAVSLQVRAGERFGLQGLATVGDRRWRQRRTRAPARRLGCLFRSRAVSTACATSCCRFGRGRRIARRPAAGQAGGSRSGRAWAGAAEASADAVAAPIACADAGALDALRTLTSPLQEQP